MLNTIIEISNKVNQCSQNDRLEIIISLRAFLFEHPVHYWISFENHESYEGQLFSCQNLNPSEMKKINENNIRKINLKPIDLFLLPKNKKLQLISLIEEIFEDLQLTVVYDKLRLNPFDKDDLHNFILCNQNYFSSNILNIYNSRNKYANYLLSEANIEHQIYETCFTLSRKNKIIDYWINIWGHSANYKESTLIEHLIIK